MKTACLLLLLTLPLGPGYFDAGRAVDPSVSTHPAKHQPEKSGANLRRQLPHHRQRPNAMVHRAAPIRTASAVRPTGLSLNHAQHRSPNPAVVGGSPNARRRNTGTIDGTGMNHRR